MAAVPKLSSLQAQLRKSSAPKPSSAVPSQAQGQKRPAEAALEGQAKKVAIVTKAPVAKSAPSATSLPGKAGPGLFAKLPPPSGAVAAKPSPAAAQAASAKKAPEIEDIKALQAKLAALKQKANTLQTELQIPKAPAAKVAVKPAPAGATVAAKPAVAKVAVAKGPPQPVTAQAAASTATSKSVPTQPAGLAGGATAKQLPVKRPASSPPPAKTNGQSSSSSATDAINIDSGTAEALKSFTTGLKDHQGKAKLVLMNRLVEAVVGGMSVEEVVYFQKLYRRKLVERAQSDGVQLAAAAATNSAPASATKSPSVATAAKSFPPSTTSSKSASPSVPSTAGVQPRPAPQRPPSAAVSSSNGSSGNPPDADLGDNPLFALVSELTEDPVCSDGEIIDVRLNQVLKRLWDGVAQKPKDWLAAWMGMFLPHEKHATVLQKFLNMAFVQTKGHSADEAPIVISELMKAHKVKMAAVEEVLVAFGHNLDGLLAMNEEAWHVYAYILLHVYPKPQVAGWGWSRVGWNWVGWWKFVEKCVASLEAGKALDVLVMLLRLVQEKEVLPLEEVWDSAKMKQVLPKISELSQSSEQEVVSRLETEGVTVTPPG